MIFITPFRSRGAYAKIAVNDNRILEKMNCKEEPFGIVWKYNLHALHYSVINYITVW